MKPFLIIKTILASAFLLSSCSLFIKPRPALSGDWKIDSFHIAHDANAIGYLLLAMNKVDSSKADLSFTKDSLIFYTNDGHEKLAYHLTKTNELILQDSTNEHFFVQQLTDSIIAIHSSDSSILFLRKL